MRHAWEDLWLFVLLALTLCAIFFDKLSKPFTRLHARWILCYRHNFCLTHGERRLGWRGECFACEREKRSRKEERDRAKRTNCGS
jgi:hypothetical protein